MFGRLAVPPTSSGSTLQVLYRSEDSYASYSAENPRALRRLRQLIREERGSFGRRLIDLCCGGGALARAYAGPGRTYLGVDANPDMIRQARLSARKLGIPATFRLSDIRRVKLHGRYDTITLLGNALPHLASRDLLSAVRNLEGHVAKDARLIIDYRDTVQQFFDGQGHGSFTQRRDGHRWVSTTQGVDLRAGVIRVEIRRDGRRNFASHGQAIWSPFILEPLLLTQGWTLVRRKPDRRWHGWRDTYRFNGSR